jgi:peroxiredoxin
MHHLKTVLLALPLALASCATSGGAAPEPTGQGAPQPPGDVSTRRGSALQPFTLPTAAGKTFDIRPHLGKDVVMISFWATWCSPCKAELQRMAPVYERLKEQGFVYVAVSTDSPSDAPKVRPYVTSAGYQFPVLLDTQSTLMQRYNPRGDMPFFLIVSRRGEIVEQHQGFSPGDEVGIEARLRSLLAAKAP